MRIGDVAARTGVSVRALRYYEEQGLLESSRTPGGQREFEESAIERVGLIQQLYGAGLSSSVIASLLPCVETHEAPPELWELFAEQRDRISSQIDELVATRERLDQVMAASESCAAGLREASAA